jgi:Holliday junction resolvase
MGTQTDTEADRRRRQIAASYRKQGYRITTPAEAGTVPAFLGDYHPDLIVEKGGDHVVIEVKTARALKGSNDLVKLAERVAAEPGWRLELVALKSQDNDVLVLAPDWLERMFRPVGSGAADVLICTYLAEILAYLLRGMALHHNIRLRDKSPGRVVHELAFAGLVNESDLTRIEDALAWQSDLMHGISVSRPPAEQATLIKMLCRDLHAQAQNSED